MDWGPPHGGRQSIQNLKSFETSHDTGGQRWKLKRVEEGTPMTSSHRYIVQAGG